ncbi:TonB-dependent receptor [Psychroflexus sp. YR1-1]|uniref:TonB-dependent receptor n=1 Tax=Psychroflexus aurantiacus TaxID=2709310 RepID=A0A6B3R914_9FLAO|nr:carboxypeptidase-like regulatory domain-containing protein [Psychroflexus aurantiacus]NEV94044.1 TonB-dependent receptor [Psychroflexus aurantiacus]
MKYLYLFLFVVCTTAVFSQTGNVQGIIFDEDQNPVPFANISSSSSGTVSNLNGFYRLSLPANQSLELKISHVGYKPITVKLSLKPNQIEEINFVLKTTIEQMGEVFLQNEKRTRVEGVTTLSPETVRKIPGANAGVENLLKTLPGVNSNNELSTQYSVRGGNYDENLVYVNDIEIYRPFLIRSGQQEGLSFVNTDLVRNVEFSAGGFKARYGDKMSSVLDIEYRRPVSFGGSFEASFLGGSASVEGVSEDKKLSAILGMRYRDNSLFVNSKDIEANFKPRFADVQTFLTYQFNSKFELSFLGNIAINSYNYEPITRQTNFGTITEPKALLVFYEGEEEDKYETYFGAFKATYKPNDRYVGKLIASAYHTKEQEYFDILANYRLGNVSTDFGDGNLGEVEFTEGAGSQFTHARNNLDALIVNLQHLASYQIDEHLLEFGAKFTHEDIRDRLKEYEVIDSAGFSIRPPLPDFANDQPYNPFDAPLEVFQSIRARNSTKIDRISAFLQWSYRTRLGDSKLWMNAGLRTQSWRVSGKNINSTTQHIWSPRAQISLKPNWDKDMLFRLSGGFYHQPPFYRALRDSTGTVIPTVEAQKSFHVVAGNDYSFKMWDRPFKLITEAYYKKLEDVNPYTIENVRIRYRARNDAEAYAYGLDMRLNGEFVPGTESWFSFGFLKTQERLGQREYIARPTDQRLKFAALFQDYVPRMPKLKLYLNLVYNTGLPGGSPQFEDPYDFQTRLPDYQRVDVGFFYALKEPNDNLSKNDWLSIFESVELGFEVFNMFDRLNSITNTFVRDASTRNQFAIPNFLSPRVLNLKLSVRF